MKRVLSESPQYLKTILDALIAALQRESRTSEPDPVAENEAQFAASREM